MESSQYLCWFLFYNLFYLDTNENCSKSNYNIEVNYNIKAIFKRQLCNWFA